MTRDQTSIDASRDRRADIIRCPCLNGATLTIRPEGAVEIATAAVPWTYALLVPLPMPGAPDAIGVAVSMEIEVVSGSVGVFLTDQVGQRVIGREAMATTAPGRCALRLNADRVDRPQLCIRTGEAGPGLIRVHRFEAWIRRRVDITPVVDQLLPALLREPGEPALREVALAMVRHTGTLLQPDEIGALACTRAPVQVPPLELILNDEAGRAVLADLDALIGLLPTYQPDHMDARAGYLGREYFATYLKQSAIRVYHLLALLGDLELKQGSILEIGSLCGQFALALRRLGFQVTAVDRYRAYAGAYDGFTTYMRDAGIDIVETDRVDELDIVSALGQFDATIAMAVIEHIPHTPREFLRMLAAHVQPGGVLALDTPNIARYWNRRQLRAGLSIHQPIEDQFHAAIPWEGHHREYTAAEMIWMLEQAGCREVRTRLFDYNRLQYGELHLDHLEAMLAAAVDPTMADTLLAGGRVIG